MKATEGNTPWRLVLILFSAGILSAFQVGKAPPVLPDIRSELGINLLYSGWLLSVFNFTGLILAAFTGAIADAVGHRRLMLAGLCLEITGCILGSFADTFPVLLLTRFLEGAGFLSVAVSTPSLIFEVTRPRDLKTALSIWSCYLPLGSSLMMLILPIILRITDWRGLWQINALAMAFFVLLLIKMTADIKVSPPLPGGLNLRRLLTDIVRTASCPGPLILALCFICYALQWLAVIGFLPTLMLDIFGFSKTMASILTATMVFVNIFGNLAGGWFLRKGYERWKIMAWAGFLMGISAFAIYGAGFHFAINYLGCLALSVCGGLIPACVLSGVPLYAPSKHLVATTNGLVIQGGQSGQFIGPPLLAFLVSQTGTWTCGAWLLSGTALLGIAASFCLSRIEYSEPS